MGTLTVFAMGDSAMWGQGLLREDTYADIAAKGIAGARRATLSYSNFARSGAKLRADIDLEKAIVYQLPSGRPFPTFVGERFGFADRFPSLFFSDDETIRFLDPSLSDQEPTLRLFGDIPASFPTVNAQIANVSAATGTNVDLLFLNGGANDVDFEKILDPDGDALTTIARALQVALYERLVATLKKARRKFPNALILYMGYFPALSDSSDRDKLEALFKYLAALPGWKLIANDFIECSMISLGLLGWILDGLLETAQDKVNEAIHRSKFAFDRGLYWINRSIAELRDDKIVFVNPSLGPENALFARKSILHEGYLPPEANKPYSVKDQLLSERIRLFPRLELVPRIEEIIAISTNPSYPADPLTLPDVKRKFDDLLASLDGPQSLIKAMQVAADSNAKFDLAIEELKKEYARLRIGVIASFLHPNETGARRYADAITAKLSFRWKLLYHVQKLHRAAPGKTRRSVRDAFLRYGLDPSKGLRACLRCVEVQSLALETVTKVGAGTFASGSLTLNRAATFRMSGPTNIFLGPGRVDLFTWETTSLHLGDIDRFEIEHRRPYSPLLPPLTLRSVSLWINGYRLARFPVRPEDYTRKHVDRTEVGQISCQYPR